MNDLQFSIIYGTPSVTTILQHSPDGWADNFIEVERSKDYYGFTTSYIPKLQFVKDGAELLRNIFYTNYNYAKIAYLKVEKLDKINLTYSQIFYGEFKFDTFKDDLYCVNITIAEGRLAQLLKKNIDTSYSLVPLIGDISYRRNPSLPNLTTAINIVTLFYFLFKKVCTNGNGYGYTFTGITTPTTANGDYEIIGEYNGDNYYVNENGYVMYIPMTGALAGKWIIYPGYYPSESYIGNRFYSNTGIVGPWYAWGSWDVGLMYPNITTPEFNFDVSIFNSYINELVITTGFWIRTEDSGIIDYPNISMTLNDFYKSMRAVASVGMSIELISGIETLVFKKIADFFDDSTEIENVGIVDDTFELSLHEKCVNSVKIGYPEKSYEFTQDICETNSTSIYTVGIRKFAAQMDLMSSFRGDGSGIIDIELGSVNDEDIFFVWLADSGLGYYKKKFTWCRRISNNLTMIPLVNAIISPERNMIANKDLITSFTYGVEYDKYNLTVSTTIKSKKDNNTYKNVIDCEYSLDGGTTYLREREGLLLSDGTRFLLPFTFTFTCQVSDTFLDKIKATPYGYITFNVNGNNFKGFIEKLKFKPTGKSQCNFTLISTADNDLTKLIR